MKHYDLIVVGGGLSGVAAAYAAAREDLRVLLIEKSGYLGGAACNNYVNPFMPYKIRKDGEATELNRGLFLDLLASLEELGGLHTNRATFNEEILKIVLDRKMAEVGVEVLLHATLIEATVDNRKIKHVVVAHRSGRTGFSSDYFIDATGDANLTFLAGASYKIGREEDELCQPMTLCFRIAGVDTEKVFATGAEINRLYNEAQEAGKIKNPRENVLKFAHMSAGVLHLNSTRIIKRSPLDPVDLSIAEREAREQMLELYLFLKNNIEGFENSTLLASAPEIGVRESRMVVGDYEITAEDLLNSIEFADTIAVGNYGVDIHSPDGTGTVIKHLEPGKYYSIPYRALIPQDLDNMLVAGRCISSTHEAQSAYRVMPICCNIGEAAGMAISIVKAGENVRMANMDLLHDMMEKYDLIY